MLHVSLLLYSVGENMCYNLHCSTHLVFFATDGCDTTHINACIPLLDIMRSTLFLQHNLSFGHTLQLQCLTSCSSTLPDIPHWSWIMSRVWIHSTDDVVYPLNAGDVIPIWFKRKLRYAVWCDMMQWAW